jgi:sodium-dependent dicarboxylate transporter 2/3/5
VHSPRTLLPIALGLVLLFATLVFPPPFSGMSVAGWRTLGLALLMITWWITEAAPLAVTSLLPLLIAPLVGIADMEKIAAAYAHPLIFLFMASFMMSLAMEKCGLHKRIAFLTLRFFGVRPSLQIAGIMLVTAFISMWMSNTATAVMMLPIGLSMIELMKSRSEADARAFANALLLGIAYAASIGGMATLIGTPPNALLAAYLANSYGIELGFARWMMIGLPISVVLLVFCWLWLARWGYKFPDNLAGSAELLQGQLDQLPPMSRSEKTVAIIFALTACAWILRPQLAKWTGLPLSDTNIAVFSAVLMFLLPSGNSNGDRILNWDNTQKLPWGVLLLFGGGLALALGMETTGLAQYIAGQLGQTTDLPPFLLILLVAVVVVALSEMSSNTAVAAGLLPLLGPISVSLTGNPLLLTIPAALAASAGFMLPVATPPNSIVFASGEVRVRDMVRAGLLMNIVAIVVISGMSYWLVDLF